MSISIDRRDDGITIWDTESMLFTTAMHHTPAGKYIAELEPKLAAAERRAEDAEADARKMRRLMLLMDMWIKTECALVASDLDAISAALALARAEREDGGA